MERGEMILIWPFYFNLDLCGLYTKGQMRQTDYFDGIRWGKTFPSIPKL